MSPTNISNRAKHSVLEEFLKEDYAFIHFDSQAQGVVIPEYLKQSPSVTLKISYFFKNPLELSNELIKATLSFDEGYVECQVPISAIWAITNISNDTRVWPDAAPEKIRDQVTDTPQTNEVKKTKQRAKKKASKIEEAVKSDKQIILETAHSIPDSNEQPSEKPKASRPLLKRIK